MEVRLLKRTSKKSFINLLQTFMTSLYSTLMYTLRLHMRCMNYFRIIVCTRITLITTEDQVGVEVIVINEMVNFLAAVAIIIIQIPLR